IASFHLIEETVPLLVHQNRPAAANGFGNQVRGFLLNGWVDLDLAHIYRTGTDAFQQRDTAAGCPFVVGGDKTFQVRAVFHHHLAVGAEATGGDNDAFSGHGKGFVLFCGQTHAGDFAVFEQDVADRRIKHYVDVALIDVTHQAADQIAAYRRAVFWTVRTVNAD